MIPTSVHCKAAVDHSPLLTVPITWFTNTWAPLHPLMKPTLGPHGQHQTKCKGHDDYPQQLVSKQTPKHTGRLKYTEVHSTYTQQVCTPYDTQARMMPTSNWEGEGIKQGPSASPRAPAHLLVTVQLVAAAQHAATLLHVPDDSSGEGGSMGLPASQAQPPAAACGCSVQHLKVIIDFDILLHAALHGCPGGICGCPA